MRVDIHTAEGVVGSVTLEAGIATASNERVAELLASVIVVSPDGQRELTLEDGEAYMLALPDRIAGSAVWADLVASVVIVSDEPAAETPADQAVTRWRAILAVEGEETADGRIIDPGALTWRPLPLTLMAMIVNSEGGHIGSEVAGRIDRIYRKPQADGTNLIVGEGVFDAGTYGCEIARMVADRTLTGVSVDLAVDEVMFRPRDAGPDYVPPETDDELESMFEPDTVMAVVKGLLLGATVCPFPAIGTAQIEVLTATAFVASGGRSPRLMMRFTHAGFDVAPPQVDDEADDGPGEFGGSAVLLYPDMAEAGAIAMPDGEPAEKLHVTLAYCPGVQKADMAACVAQFAAGCPSLYGTISGTAAFDDSGQGDGHPMVALPNVKGLARLRTELVQALEAYGIPVAADYDFMPHLTLGYSTDGPQMPSHEGRIGQPVSFSALTLSDSNGERTDYPIGDELTASAAGLTPVDPPLEWFGNPQLSEATPLTVRDDGYVFGHVADWRGCHIGEPAGPGVCVPPPRSKSGYAYFHLGELVTAEGEAISVGQITMDTSHAPLGPGVTAKAATKHYDDTSTVVAHIRCGEDAHGIWFAGALSPDLPASTVRKLRAAKISGDWRKLNGRADMIAAHCVNVPGFPIPRPAAHLLASAAYGEEALIAAVGLGIVGVDYPDPVRTQARIEALAARAQGLDALLAAAFGIPDELTAGLELTIRIDDPERVEVPVIVDREKLVPITIPGETLVVDRDRVVPVEVPGETKIIEKIVPKIVTQTVERETLRVVPQITETHRVERVETRAPMTMQTLSPQTMAMALTAGDVPQAYDQEIALQVDFFAVHGYWADMDLAGGNLDGPQMKVVRAAAELVTNATSSEGALIRDRLVDEGYLN